MISLQTTEMIQVRIVELLHRRNRMLAFTMNTKLQQQAMILNSQILALRSMLKKDMIPKPDYDFPEWDDDCNQIKGMALLRE